MYGLLFVMISRFHITFLPVLPSVPVGRMFCFYPLSPLLMKVPVCVTKPDICWT